MNTTSALRSLLLPVALVGALGGFAAGCGDGGIDESKIEDVKKQGEALQQDAKQLQEDAAQVSEDVKSGKITAEEAQKKIEAQTKEIEDKAKQAGTDAIEAVEDNDYLSDEDKKQLQDAKDQLATTTP